jgi:hypothetical protein
MSETLAQLIDNHIEQSTRSLVTMRASILAKRWKKFYDAEAEFKASMHGLEELVGSRRAEFLKLDYADKFRELSQLQRRVMRLLATQMESVQEDMDTLDQGIRRLRHLAEVAEES